MDVLLSSSPGFTMSYVIAVRVRVRYTVVNMNIQVDRLKVIRLKVEGLNLQFSSLKT
jgi:hypothetical protein